jgi:hypothetical protein
VPHLAAILCAHRKRPFLAGLFCGVAFLFNAKGLFVMAVCAVWLPGVLLPLAAGSGAVLGVAAIAGWASGGLVGYWQQVWEWGWIYAAGSPVTHPLRLGVVRTLHWLGFHAALALGTAIALARGSREDRWKLGSWLILSFAAVCLGTRFAPHYYLQLLPALVVAGARGFVLAYTHYRRSAFALACLALVVPLVRFGPRYALLARDQFNGRAVTWRDAALDLDSQKVAAVIRSNKRSGDTLAVWGYRPDMYVYSRLTTASRFWDSQPLTGVPADRHLQAAAPIYVSEALHNRDEFVRSHPVWFVDGLGLLNPHLAPAEFPEMREWLKNYEIVARTPLSIVYRRR